MNLKNKAHRVGRLLYRCAGMCGERVGRKESQVVRNMDSGDKLLKSEQVLSLGLSFLLCKMENQQHLPRRIAMRTD